MRCLGAGVVVAIAATVASGAAWAGETEQLERECKSVVSGDPSSKALAAALARVGSQGTTRLDLTVRDQDDTPHENGEAQPPPKLAASREWKKPLDAARAIAGAKSMAGARELVLDRFPLTVETARVLAASPNLRALEALSLRRTQVTAPALRELLAPGAFPALAELDLTNNGLTPADLQELAKILADRKLRRLSLGVDRSGLPGYLKEALPRGTATRDGLVRIAAARGLAELNLNDEPIGFATLEALLKTGRTQPLDIETQGFPKLSAKQLGALAALDPEAHVTFSISSFEIDPGQLRAFDKSGWLAKLSSLEVNCGDACARILAGSKHADKLRELSFGCGGDDTNYAFTKAAAIALSRATGLSALRRLHIINDVEVCQEAGIGGAGLRALLKAPFAAQLESLTLDDQGLNDVDYIALANAKSLGALKELVATEYESILTPTTTPALFRDGALAGHLEVLRLRTEGSLGPEVMAKLVKGIKMPKLRALELPNMLVPMRDLMRFARTPGLEQVRVLVVLPQLSDGDGSLDKFWTELGKHLAPGACFR